jgi:hypothetical protein
MIEAIIVLKKGSSVATLAYEYDPTDPSVGGTVTVKEDNKLANSLRGETMLTHCLYQLNPSIPIERDWQNVVCAARAVSFRFNAALSIDVAPVYPDIKPDWVSEVGDGEVQVYPVIY